MNRKQAVTAMSQGKTSAVRVASHWISAARVSLSDFWKLVDKIGWGTKTTDTDAIEKAIMLKYSPQEAAALGNIRSQLFDDLYDRLDRWGDAEDMSFGVGDDGFSDLINHIIGLGKREYDAVMKDPKRGWERAQKGTYTESFSYAFPSRSDYASLNIKHYTRWATKLIHAFQEHITQNRALKSLHRDALVIVSALEMMAAGQVEAFLDTERTVIPLFKKMQRNYEAKLKMMGGKPTWGGGSDNPLTSGAWLENLYHDVRRFAEKTPVKLATQWGRTIKEAADIRRVLGPMLEPLRPYTTNYSQLLKAFGPAMIEALETCIWEDLSEPMDYGNGDYEVDVGRFKALQESSVTLEELGYERYEYPTAIQASYQIPVNIRVFVTELRLALKRFVADEKGFRAELLGLFEGRSAKMFFKLLVDGMKNILSGSHIFEDSLRQSWRFWMDGGIGAFYEYVFPNHLNAKVVGTPKVVAKPQGRQIWFDVLAKIELKPSDFEVDAESARDFPDPEDRFGYDDEYGPWHDYING